MFFVAECNEALSGVPENFNFWGEPRHASRMAVFEANAMSVFL